MNKEIQSRRGKDATAAVSAANERKKTGLSGGAVGEGGKRGGGGGVAG